MLVVLAGVAFAQESRFEIALGPGVQTAPDDDSLGALAGGVDARFNPNGASFRITAMDSLHRPELLTRDVSLKLGLSARQPRMSVGFGLEGALMEDPTGHFPASGLYVEFYATYPRFITRSPIFAPLQDIWIGGTLSILNDDDLRIYAVDDIWAAFRESEHVSLRCRFQFAYELGEVPVDSTVLVEVRLALGPAATPPDRP